MKLIEVFILPSTTSKTHARDATLLLFLFEYFLLGSESIRIPYTVRRRHAGAERTIEFCLARSSDATGARPDSQMANVIAVEVTTDSETG